MTYGITKLTVDQIRRKWAEKVRKAYEEMGSLADMEEMIRFLKAPAYSASFRYALCRFLREKYKAAEGENTVTVRYENDDGKVFVHTFAADTDTPKAEEVEDYISLMLMLAADRGMEGMFQGKLLRKYLLGKQENVSRENLMKMALAFDMDTSAVCELLEAMDETPYNFRDPIECISYFCQYSQESNYWEVYKRMCARWGQIISAADSAAADSTAADSPNGGDSFEAASADSSPRAGAAALPGEAPRAGAAAVPGEFPRAGSAAMPGEAPRAGAAAVPGEESWRSSMMEEAIVDLSFEEEKDLAAREEKMLRYLSEHRKMLYGWRRSAYVVLEELLDELYELTGAKDDTELSIMMWSPIWVQYYTKKSENGGVNRSDFVPWKDLLDLPKTIYAKPLWRARILKLRERKVPVEKRDILFLSCMRWALDRDSGGLEALNEFMLYTNDLLDRCGLSMIYPPNPYDRMILLAVCSGSPFDILSDLFRAATDEEKLEQELRGKAKNRK